MRGNNSEENNLANDPSAASAIETRVIRKLQLRLIPFLFLLYVIAMVDRINIGFAALTMNKELGLTSQQYSVAAGIEDVRVLVDCSDSRCSAL